VKESRKGAGGVPVMPSLGVLAQVKSAGNIFHQIWTNHYDSAILLGAIR